MLKQYSIGFTKFAIGLSIYVGFFLNAAVLFRSIRECESRVDFLIVILSAVAMPMIVFFLLALASLAGQRIVKLLSAVLIIGSSVSSYYMTFFNVSIGYGILVSVLTTDTDLSVEMVGYSTILWVIVTGIIPCIVLSRAQLSFAAIANYSRRVRVGIQLAVCCVAYSAGAATLNGIDSVARYQARQMDTFVASPSGIVAHMYAPSNWVSALGVYAWEKLYDERKQSELLDPAAQFNYIAPDSLDDTLVVFVIGETTRGDHVGQLGYKRDTMPLLRQEENALLFKGLACDTATKLSLRCMFVRHGGTEDTEARTLKEKNIFSVLSALGFRSELFAMQSELWFYNRMQTLKYTYREELAAEYVEKRLDDMLLIEQLKNALEDNTQKGKRLITLHTKGSHFLYSARYPREFAHFEPECRGVDEYCSLEQLVNSYDNTVRYVDLFLSRVIDVLRERNAILFYSADHGESLGEGTQFHATPRNIAPPEQFSVPIMVWGSQEFLAASEKNAKAFENLRQAQALDTIVHQTSLFDSILGCLGYESPDGGIDHSNNLCSGAYSAYAQTFPLTSPYPDAAIVKKPVAEQHHATIGG